MTRPPSSRLCSTACLPRFTAEALYRLRHADDDLALRLGGQQLAARGAAARRAPAQGDQPLTWLGHTRRLLFSVSCLVGALASSRVSRSCVATSKSRIGRTATRSGPLSARGIRRWGRVTANWLL